MSQAVALVREIPDSFDRAITSEPGTKIDVALARSQHGKYGQQLESAGYRIVALPADPSYPDCVFVEDTVVVLGDTALITRPGAESRRGETTRVAEVVGQWLDIIEMSAPGTLDGGDVIVTRSEVLVGKSARTNPEGIEQLARIAADTGRATRVVEVREGLHLKSAVLPLDGHTLVVTPGAVDQEALNDYRILYEDQSERFKFSALPLRDGRVLVTANAPRTANLVSDRGQDIVDIDVSQIQAADGGLTCMSVLFEIP